MKWVCEWHSEEAASMVEFAPEKARVIFCRKCHRVTFHARMEEVKESDHEDA